MILNALYSVADDVARTVRRPTRQWGRLACGVFVLVCATAEAREGQPWPIRHIAGETVPGGADGHCIADVDGDGASDIVVAHDLHQPHGAIGIHFHPGEKAVRGQWPSLCLSGMHTTEGARTADLDGDGRPEVIAGNQSAALSLWFPPEDPKRTRQATGWQRIDLPDACGRALEVQSVQIDGRHGPDIVAGREHLWWLACPANPRDPQAWIRYPISAPDDFAGAKVRKVKTILFEDMDGDKDRDVFITSTMGTMWFENDGCSRDPRKPWDRHSIDPQRLNFGALGDLDGDGIKDVVIGNGGAGKEAAFLRWLKRIHPSRNEWKAFELPVPPKIKIKSIAIADVDGDGKSDIVVGGTSPPPGFSTVIWLRCDRKPNDPAARWVDHEIRPGGAKSDYIILFDMDADGDLDVTFTNESKADKIHWFENTLRPPRQGSRRSEPR